MNMANRYVVVVGSQRLTQIGELIHVLITVKAATDLCHLSTADNSTGAHVSANRLLYYLLINC